MGKILLNKTGSLAALLLLALALPLLCPGFSFATQALLSDDAYTNSTRPTSKFGNSATLSIGGSTTTFIKFDLSTLPAGAVGTDIEKATLILFVTSVKPAGSFDVVRVTSDWNESSITFNTSPTLGSIEVPSVGVGAADAKNFIAIDVTTLVQDWLDGVLANNGIALVPNGSVHLQLDTKESGLTAHEAKLDITLVALGAGASAADHSASVFNDANETIANATVTTITFNQERYDTDGMHDTVTNNSRITITAGAGAGKYLIGGCLDYTANTTGIRNIGMVLNGVTLIASNQQNAASSFSTVICVNRVYNLSVADYVELTTHHNSGGSLDVTASPDFSPEFWVQKLTP